MGSTKRYQHRRSRKRKFHERKPAEQQTPPTPTLTDDDNTGSKNLDKSASSMKIDTSFVNESDNHESDNVREDCNIIMNTDLLFSLLYMIGRCPCCTSAININLDESCKKGMSYTFPI